MMRFLPFEDVFKDESSGNIKTLQTEYLKNGSVAIVDQGKALIAGFTNDEKRICKSELPVIVFGDHTKCFKFVDFPFAIGADGVKVLKPKIKADEKFLFYYLKSIRLPNAGYDRHFKYLRRTEVLLPPLSEQKRIAEVLDKANALREKRRLALRKIDALLQSVFLEMFGDPVKNPKGWEIVLFDEVCKTRLGKMLDEKKRTGKNLRPYLRNANVQWNRFDLSTVYEMDFDERERANLKLEYGDLLICEGGEVGRTAIWRNELPECYYQKALHKGRPNLEKVTPEFLMFVFWFYSENNGFKDYVTFATIAHLTGEKLKTIKIPIPAIELQLRFSEIIKKIENLKNKIIKSAEKIESLFQSLQQRAFKGELFNREFAAAESEAENVWRQSALF